MRRLTYLDKIIQEVDSALQSLVAPKNRLGRREVPGNALSEASLSAEQKRQVVGFMRVNHSGEVCAQALYQGQALTAKLSSTQQQMREAALEEIDHLAWCEKRLEELDAKPALLNPLWYLGSFMIGAFAGFLSDEVSLGFVAETEKQVGLHLSKHLKNLPEQDKKTQAILETMQADEAAHAKAALEAGAIVLPDFVRNLMKEAAKLMTKTSYHF